MSRDCCVALPRGAMGSSAACDCGISCSYSLTIFNENVTSFPVNKHYQNDRSVNQIFV